jgi:hypothetical protein
MLLDSSPSNWQYEATPRALDLSSEVLPPGTITWPVGEGIILVFFPEAFRTDQKAQKTFSGAFRNESVLAFQSQMTNTTYGRNWYYR